MMRVIPATELKNLSGAVMRRVEQGELQIVTRAGMPVGAIIPMEEFEKRYPEEMADVSPSATEIKRKRAWQQLMKSLDEMQKGGEKFSEEEVDRDVMKAVDEVRHGKRKKK